MFKNLKSRLHLGLSRSRKSAESPPDATKKENPAAVIETAPPYLLAPRRKTSTLFELEALLSSIIDSHHASTCGQDAKAETEREEKAREGGGVLPSYEELYKELEKEGGEDGVGVSLMQETLGSFVSVEAVPLPAPSCQPSPPKLRRKPKGLDNKRSTREKALEALMRLLDQGESGEDEKRVRKFPSVEMGAVRRRALEGLRRRGWDVTVISRRKDGQGINDIVS